MLRFFFASPHQNKVELEPSSSPLHPLLIPGDFEEVNESLAVSMTVASASADAKSA